MGRLPTGEEEVGGRWEENSSVAINQGKHPIVDCIRAPKTREKLGNPSLRPVRFPKTREISRGQRINSVEINPSLLMIRE